MKSTSRREQWQMFRRVMAFGRPYLSGFATAVVLSLLIIVLEAIYFWVPASLVQTLFRPSSEPLVRPPVSLSTLNDLFKYWTYSLVRAADSRQALQIFCLVMIGACLAKNVAQYAWALLVTRLNLSVVRDLRNTIYDHLLRLPMAYFTRARSGDTVSKIVNDVEQVNQAVAQVFQRILIEPLRVLAHVVLLLIISPRLTLVVALLYPALGWGLLRIGHSVRRRSRRMLDSLAGVMAVLNETLQGLRAVKMFNMNDIESRKFRNENATYVRSAYRSAVVRHVTGPLTETLGVLVTAVLLWYGGGQVLAPHSRLTAEDFIRFLLLLLASYRPLKALGEIHMALQSGMAGAERIFETLDQPPEILRPFHPSRVPTFEGALTFEHVWFRYPGTDTDVLQDLTFTVEKGQCVALVGPSGSGKTTVVDCIARFYEVQKGRILLDGRDIRTFDLVGYRHLFGIVSQDTFLFNDTVFANIAYGVQGATEADVRRVAEAANAWEFIQGLPDGLQTVVGERGVLLSGGQRQRIAIARALLRNPPILILDEATSALDSESERLVQQAINRLMEGRTTIVVAHRLSTVRHADRILMLVGGRLVASGTHEELLAREERYRTLYALQTGSVHDPEPAPEA